MLVDYHHDPNYYRDQYNNKIQLVVIDQHLKTLMTKRYNQERCYLDRINKKMIEATNVINAVDIKWTLTKNK